MIYTIPRNEKKVHHELTQRQVESFLPLQAVVRLWGNRKQKLDVPLFPNYLFVNIARDKLWSILSIKGVVRYVSYGGAPAAISNEEIEIIRKLLVYNAEITTKELYNVGERVRVKHGPFAGLEGKVLEIKGKTKFFIELDKINRFLSVDIGSTILEKVEVC